MSDQLATIDRDAVERRIASVTSTKLTASPEDPRDFAYVYTGAPIPRKTNWRQYDTPIRDQAVLGSCVAHANIAGLERIARMHGDPTPNYSELFAHYKAREVDSILGAPEDGCYPRSGVKVLNRFGTPLEKDYPYEVAKYNDNPSSMVHTLAMQNRLGRYERVEIFLYDINGWSTRNLKRALSEGVSVSVAMVVPRWLFYLRGPLDTHRAQIEGANRDWVGNHMMLLSDFDDDLGGFIVRNSWGTGWGDGGYGLIPYDKAHYFYEAWVLRSFRDWNVAPPVDLSGVNGQIFRLYRAVLRREPDMDGLAFHRRAIEVHGHSLVDVATNFTRSPEFQQTFGNLSDEDFVTVMYQSVLDREPDPEGHAFHVERLRSGVSRGALVVGFTESPEYIDKLKYFR